MRRRFLPLLILFVGALVFFAVGIVSATLLGLVPEHSFAGRPFATISLDLADQVRRLQVESARLNMALEGTTRTIGALESRFATLSKQEETPDGASAARAARIAALETELQQVRQQNNVLTAEAGRLRSGQEAARREAAAYAASLDALQKQLSNAEQRSAASAQESERTGNDLGAAKQALAASVAVIESLRADLRESAAQNRVLESRIETLRKEKDTASRDAARGAETIEDLQRERANLIAEHDSERLQLNAENAGLRESLDQLGRETTTLRDVGTIPETSAPEPPKAGPARATAGGTGLSDGIAAYQAADYPRAFRIWEPLAVGGSARAQFHLGALYFEGRGTGRDLAQARHWLASALSKGYEPAQALLQRVDAETPAR